MIRRIISVILALILVCAFTGCNRKEKEKYTDIHPGVPERAEIHIYTKGYGGDGTPLNKAEIDNMLEEIAKNTSETINIAPVFHWLPYENYDSEILRLVQSGEKIDAFTCYTPHTYIQQNLLLDITDLFPRHASKYYHELMENQISRDYLYQGAVDGKLYLIPYYGIDNPRYCIVAVKELAEKYAPGGLETMEDYGEFLKKIKENEKNYLPGSVNAHDFFIAYMEGNGYYSEYATFFFSRFNKPENIFAIEQTSEFMDAWNLLSRWHAEGYIQGDDNTNTFYNGKLASELASLRNIENVLGQLSTVDTQFTIIPLYMDSTFLINTSGRGLVISNTCAIPERVISFVEWIHESQENYDLFRYGVKDRNYSLQGDRVTFPRSVKPFLTWFAADYFTDIRYERLTPNIDANFKEVYREAGFKNTVTSRQLYGEYMDKVMEDQNAIEELTREYEQIEAILQVYFANMEEFARSIDEGKLHISPDELAQKQKKAGVEQILSVYGKMKQMTAELLQAH